MLTPLNRIIMFVGNVESQNVAETREELMRAGVKMGETHRFGELEFCDGFDPENHRFQISNRK